MTQFDVPNKPVISKIPNIGYYNIATQHSKLDLQFVAYGWHQIHTPGFMWVFCTQNGQWFYDIARVAT